MDLGLEVELCDHRVQTLTLCSVASAGTKIPTFLTVFLEGILHSLYSKTRILETV